MIGMVLRIMINPRVKRAKVLDPPGSLGVRNGGVKWGIMAQLMSLRSRGVCRKEDGVTWAKPNFVRFSSLPLMMHWPP